MGFGDEFGGILGRISGVWGFFWVRGELGGLGLNLRGGFMGFGGEFGGVLG